MWKSSLSADKRNRVPQYPRISTEPHSGACETTHNQRTNVRFHATRRPIPRTGHPTPRTGCPQPTGHVVTVKMGVWGNDRSLSAWIVTTEIIKTGITLSYKGEGETTHPPLCLLIWLFWAVFGWVCLCNVFLGGVFLCVVLSECQICVKFVQSFWQVLVSYYKFVLNLFHFLLMF